MVDVVSREGRLADGLARRAVGRFRARAVNGGSWEMSTAHSPTQGCSMRLAESARPRMRKWPRLLSRLRPAAAQVHLQVRCGAAKDRLHAAVGRLLGRLLSAVCCLLSAVRC